MKSIITAIILTIGLITSCNSQKSNTADTIKDVSAKEFKDMISKNDGIILDVRTPEEVKESKIEGSININIYDSDFDSKIGELDKNKTVYVYCRSGGRSGNAMNKMQEIGFKSVYNLDGGITSWKSNGFETK